MRVLRVPLQTTLSQCISVPVGCPILHVAANAIRSGIDLWYLERGDETKRRDVGVWMVGSAEPMPVALSQYAFHLGTVTMRSGLVWHVFEGPVVIK